MRRDDLTETEATASGRAAAGELPPSRRTAERARHREHISVQIGEPEPSTTRPRIICLRSQVARGALRHDLGPAFVCDLRHHLPRGNLRAKRYRGHATILDVSNSEAHARHRAEGGDRQALTAPAHAGPREKKMLCSAETP
jgi:hypothetical protein